MAVGGSWWNMQCVSFAAQIISNAGPMLPSPITAIAGIEHLPQEPVEVCGNAKQRCV